MMEEYKLFPFTDWSRVSEIQDLFRQGLGETTQEYWIWKYNTENGLSEKILLVAENYSGKIVGMAGLQFTEYQVNDKRMMITQFQDLIIAPDCRGTGLMRKIYSKAMEISKEHGSVAFMEHPNENSLPPLLKYGATDMGGIGSITSKKHLFSMPRKTIYQKEIDGWNLNILDRMPEDVFFETHKSCYKLVKNKDFLRWRFDNNSNEKFQWVTIRKDSILCGYFVFQTFRGRFHTAVNIYDYEIKEGIPMNILKQAIRMLKSHGSWISLWGIFSEEDYMMWKNAGLSNQDNRKSNFMIHLFYNQKLPTNWHLTRADLDF